jgi:hypothetical protein
VSDADVLELAVLQAVRLKGRVGRAELPDVVDGAEAGALAATVDVLVDAGLLVDAATLRLADPGRARLAELLAAERSGVDAEAAAAVYADFDRLNSGFKSVVSQWQIARSAPGAEPDAAVLARVDDVHRAVVPVIIAASDLVPRLRSYVDKLGVALSRAKQGDMAWLSRPTVDSYHTLWFELHEELIGLAGRTRSHDADSG